MNTSGSVITRLEATAVRVPIEEPIWAPGMLIEYRDYLIVRLQCKDGTKGNGFSYIGTGGGISALTAANELILHHVLGQDASQIQAIWDDLMGATRIQGRGGLVMNAISAIDIALFDRNSRAAGLPLYRFLGAEKTHSVPAYASGGYIKTADEDENPLVAEIETYRAAGWDKVKIKCGFSGLTVDTGRVRAARRALGDEGSLMLDAYNKWTSIEDARPHIESYLETNPYWIEDPFVPEYSELYEDLAGIVDCRLATGEIYYGPEPFRALTGLSAKMVFQPEAPRCGGITGWMRIAKLAAENGIEVVPCWYHHLHMHLVAATDNAPLVECFPDSKIFNFDLLIDQPVEAKDGNLILPERYGVGFEFLESALEQFKLAKPVVLELA